MLNIKSLNNYGLTSFNLKCVGILTMLIDHVGCLVYRLSVLNHDTTLRTAALLMRNVGRVAFPLFVMLLVEGFLHTHSRAKYIVRLLVFALISEYPYRLCFRIIQPSHSLNIGFTLLLIFLMLMALERAKKLLDDAPWKTILASAAIILFFAVIARQFPISYGWKGIIVAAILYFVRASWNRSLATTLVMSLRSGLGYGYLLLLLVMPFYNGRRGSSMKYAFYLFYPLHLLGIYLIAQQVLL